MNTTHLCVFPLLLLHSCFVLNLYHSVPIQEGWRESNTPDRWGRFSTNAPNRRQNPSGNAPLSYIPRAQLYLGNHILVSSDKTSCVMFLVIMVPPPPQTPIQYFLIDPNLLFSHIDYRPLKKLMAEIPLHCIIVLLMVKMIAEMNHSISLWTLLKDQWGSTLKNTLVFSLQSLLLHLQWGS